MDEEMLVDKIKQLVAEEGMVLNALEEDKDKLIAEYVFPSLKEHKDILRRLYQRTSYPRRGWLGKVKDLIVKIVGNISMNTVERAVISQQKFNDNVILVLENLLAENKELKKKISDLTSKSPDGK